jgi:uncharacterized protein YrrD
MSDPVSWMVIEAGWPVVDSDGNEIGPVTDVIADEEKDIFSGLMVRVARFRAPRYVAAERVRTIVEGRIELDVTADALPEQRD